MNALSVTLLRSLADRLSTVDSDIVRQTEDAALVALYEIRIKTGAPTLEEISGLMAKRFGRSIKAASLKAYYSAARDRMERKLQAAKAGDPSVAGVENLKDGN